MNRRVIPNVSSYKLANETLIYASGSSLRNKKLFINNKETYLDRVAAYIPFKEYILLTKWSEKDTFVYNYLDKQTTIINDIRVQEISNDFIVFLNPDTDIFLYKNYNFIDIFSSKYFFNILEENYGITYSETHLSKINFQDEILWQFPLSSLGGSVYEPDKTDEIDKILGIAHGNVWFYTRFSRLVALELETGTKVYSLDCFGVYLDEKTKNIFAIASNTITIIDTEKLTIAERYNFLEADPTGIGAYRRVFSPLLQGDYFTFLGEKEKEYGGIGWVGIFDYKARKLIWEYEVISQEERNATRNQLVISQPLYMSDNKLYIKDIKDNLHIFERDF